MRRVALHWIFYFFFFFAAATITILPWISQSYRKASLPVAVARQDKLQLKKLNR
jgi:cytochrome b561